MNFSSFHPILTNMDWLKTDELLSDEMSYKADWALVSEGKTVITYAQHGENVSLSSVLSPYI